MIFLPFALSLSSTFTKVGAIAAFAAVVGIAILSLLVFSQARELKRLREWAGRAPERAADLEQRVTAAAAVRVQQQSPAVQQQSPAVQPVRTVAQAAPAQARAAADGAGPATRVVATPAPPPGQALTAAGALAAPASGVATAVPSSPPAPPAAPAPTPAVPAVGVPASVAGATQTQPATAGSPPAGVAEPPRPAPATAAAAAAANPRAPSPPRASAPAPANDQPVAPAARRPPAPPVAVGSSAPAAVRRPDPRTEADQRMPVAAARTPISQQPRSTYTARRSPRRRMFLIAGGLIVVAAAVAVALTSLGGSSGGKVTNTSASTAKQRGTPSSTRHSHKTSPKSAAGTPAVSPAETNVAVLNATEAEGLARRTASALQQNGYSQAVALNGHPPGSGQVSVVEYASGHQAEAEAVARSASVTDVQPIEAAVTALAGSASVVLIVGADKSASG